MTDGAAVGSPAELALSRGGQSVERRAVSSCGVQPRRPSIRLAISFALRLSKLSSDSVSIREPVELASF